MNRPPLDEVPTKIHHRSKSGRLTFTFPLFHSVNFDGCMEGGAGGLRQRRSEVVEQPVAAEGQEKVTALTQAEKGNPLLFHVFLSLCLSS